MQMSYPSLPQWTTDRMAMAAPKEQVSADDLNNLLKGRRFGQKQAPDVDMCPSIPDYNPTEMAELEAYCKKRGIVGINFAGMNPTQVLRMLRARVEGRYEAPLQRGLING